MASEFPSVSTDQVAAFAELARQGSLRKAAEQLGFATAFWPWKGGWARRCTTSNAARGAGNR